MNLVKFNIFPIIYKFNVNKKIFTKFIFYNKFKHKNN